MRPCAFRHPDYFPLRLNQPTPAIVSQEAVRRLPRPALLLLCLAYVLPGFLGREPWKNADVAGFGYMASLARGASAWLHPQLLGQDSPSLSLLPYWLGAWAIQISPSWIAPDFAARIPFMLLLPLTLAATWYAVYYLARGPQAQPVSFAFGGEARPTDYARTIADGGLLALIACLGLLQLSHETTPALAQLSFCALSFYGLAALPYRPFSATAGLIFGLAGLGLSGAPAMAALLGLGGAVVQVQNFDGAEQGVRTRTDVWTILAITLLTALVSWALGLWHWRVVWPDATWAEWHSLGRLWLWFSWPAGPLALWTLWRWRRQRWSRHMALPLLFVVVGFAGSLSTAGSDRALLLTLPAVAALAAFALPTLSRSLSALIDWFTLLFFSGGALFFWFYWIAAQSGVPNAAAASVARLYPGFVPSFSLLPFLIALLATLAWVWLVRWRTGRQRAAIWKSLVLPAGGTALSWLLAMTLWLPLGDYRLSYAPLVREVSAFVNPKGCVQVHGMTRAQIAALQFHGSLELEPATPQARCPWLLVNATAKASLIEATDLSQWTLLQTIQRPADKQESVLLFRRNPSERAP
jgi:hypothetical protein